MMTKRRKRKKRMKRTMIMMQLCGTKMATEFHTEDQIENI